MKWEDVLPPNVASEQSAWERRMAMLRAVDAGVSVKEIARHLGISIQGARNALMIARVRCHRGSPIERYFKTPIRYKSKHKSLRMRQHFPSLERRNVKIEI